MNVKILTAFALLAPFMIVAAPLEVVSPKDGATMPTLTDGQKAYLAMPHKERIAYFASKECRKKMAALRWYPKRVRLEWKGGAPGASYRVSVKRVPDGREFFAYEGTNTFVEVENLEIARDYEWTVSSGEDRLRSHFSTEGQAPRLMHIHRVPNARDLGGRIGFGGRRVQQGMVFRTTGLNDNATTVRYKRRELEKAGKITPEMRAKEKKIKDHIAKYQGYLADPGKFPRSHRGWQAWSKRHPSATVSEYFKMRIEDDKHHLEKVFHVAKKRIPGKNHLGAATKRYLGEVLGIRSEIDLRSDNECYGMTGSPIGPSVKWFHYSSSAYGSMQKERGREAFKKVFSVFLDEKNYPIVFHCISGQDRTGSVAFILNGLLGVSEEELYLDWETTGFWNPHTTFCHERCFDRLVNGFNEKVEGANIHEKIENYVLSLGFTKKDIEKFRTLMLE